MCQAANPGCILEDFIRWHSPPDWEETGLNSVNSDPCDSEDSSSRRGQLSRRMQKEGTLEKCLIMNKNIPALVF